MMRRMAQLMTSPPLHSNDGGGATGAIWSERRPGWSKRRRPPNPRCYSAPVRRSTIDSARLKASASARVDASELRRDLAVAFGEGGRAPSALKRFAILAGLLTVPAVLIAVQLYAAYRLRGLRVAFSAGVAIQLIHWELWAFLGPFVWTLEQRWPLTSPNRRAALLRHAIAAPAIAVLALGLNVIGYHALIRLPGGVERFAGYDRSVAATGLFYFVSYFHVELLIYGVIVAAAHAARTTVLLRAKEHDTLRLEAELTGAKLTALRMQLQPHFLFNTLHTISSLVLQRRNDEAVTLLAELGELLRGTLAQRDTELAPLNDELVHLKRYLRIEEARFGDRLRIDWSVDPAAMDALIPPFILQPLVEN